MPTKKKREKKSQKKVISPADGAAILTINRAKEKKAILTRSQGFGASPILVLKGDDLVDVLPHFHRLFLEDGFEARTRAVQRCLPVFVSDRHQGTVLHQNLRQRGREGGREGERERERERERKRE